MFFKVLVEDNMVLCGNFEYELCADDLHKVIISDVLYGTDDYDFLSDKLNEYVDIELEYNGKKFAKLTDVMIKNIKYNLKNESTTFVGTFKEYSENLRVIIDEMIG